MEGLENQHFDLNADFSAVCDHLLARSVIREHPPLIIRGSFIFSGFVFRGRASNQRRNHYQRDTGSA